MNRILYRSRIILLFIGIMLVFASCGKEQDAKAVDRSLIPGKWVRQGTQEYWRYYSSGNGVTWDESEDISEEESNLTFTWTLDGDQLTHVFTGSSGGQAVPKVYTVTSITPSTMLWTDFYGSTIYLSKQ